MKDIKCVGFKNGDDISTIIHSVLYEWLAYKKTCHFRYELKRGTSFSHPHREIHVHETKTQIVVEKQHYLKSSLII